MIPRILHQVWLEHSPPMPDIVRECRERQRLMHPDWTIMQWTDTSIMDHPLLSPIKDQWLDAYRRFALLAVKPIAIQAELVRLSALYIHGGVYLDADMWPVRPLDDLLSRPIILGYMPGDWTVSEAVIGVRPRNLTVFALLFRLCRQQVCRLAGSPLYGRVSMNLTGCACGHGMPVLPCDYFVPHACQCNPDERYAITPNTRTIHLWHRDYDYDLRILRETAELCYLRQYSIIGNLS